MISCVLAREMLQKAVDLLTQKVQVASCLLSKLQDAKNASAGSGQDASTIGEASSAKTGDACGMKTVAGSREDGIDGLGMLSFGASQRDIHQAMMLLNHVYELVAHAAECHQAAYEGMVEEVSVFL